MSVLVSLVLVSYLLFISPPPDLLTEGESDSVSDSDSDSLIRERRMHSSFQNMTIGCLPCVDGSCVGRCP